jgi:hypothetical protein
MHFIWSVLLCSSVCSTTEPRKKERRLFIFPFFKVLAGLTRLTRTLRYWDQTCNHRCQLKSRSVPNLARCQLKSRSVPNLARCQRLVIPILHHFSGPLIRSVCTSVCPLSGDNRPILLKFGMHYIICHWRNADSVKLTDINISNITNDKLMVGFEVLTAVSTKMAVFWVLPPCSLVDGDWAKYNLLNICNLRLVCWYVINISTNNVCNMYFFSLRSNDCDFIKYWKTVLGSRSEIPSHSSSTNQLVVEKKVSYQKNLFYFRE